MFQFLRRLTHIDRRDARYYTIPLTLGAVCGVLMGLVGANPAVKAVFFGLAAGGTLIVMLIVALAEKKFGDFAFAAPGIALVAGVTAYGFVPVATACLVGFCAGVLALAVSLGLWAFAPATGRSVWHHRSGH